MGVLALMGFGFLEGIVFWGPCYILAGLSLSLLGQGACGAAGLDFGEEVVAFVVDEDEGGEILDFDFPDGFHSELGVFEELYFLD